MQTAWTLYIRTLRACHFPPPLDQGRLMDRSIPQVQVGAYMVAGVAVAATCLLFLPTVECLQPTLLHDYDIATGKTECRSLGAFPPKSCSHQRLLPPKSLQDFEGGWLGGSKPNCFSWTLTSLQWKSKSMYRVYWWLRSPGKCLAWLTRDPDTRPLKRSWCSSSVLLHGFSYLPHLSCIYVV